MGSGKYVSIMPRIALEMKKLLDPEELLSLVGKDLKEIYDFLLDTTYGDSIDFSLNEYKEERLLLEDSIMQEYARSFERLIVNSSNYLKKLLLSITHKFDAINFKVILKMIHNQIEIDEILKNLIPIGNYNQVNSRNILKNIHTLQDLFDSLKPNDFGYFLKSRFNSEITLKDIVEIEILLDKAVYEGILQEIQKLNSLDQNITKHIIGIEIDAYNVIMICKGKDQHIPEEKIKSYYIPGGNFNKDILYSAIKLPNRQSILSWILNSVEKKNYIYQKVFTEVEKGSFLSLSHIEYLLEKAALEMSQFELKNHAKYYNIGYILSFLYLKWAEIKNLRCIINATVRNASDLSYDLFILPTT